MPTLTSLQQANDNRGNPFFSNRPAKSWGSALSGTGTYVTGPFLATTRVVRVIGGRNDVVQVTLNSLNPFIIARSIAQDIIVFPGDTITFKLDPSSSTGTVGLIEMA